MHASKIDINEIQATQELRPLLTLALDFSIFNF